MTNLEVFKNEEFGEVRTVLINNEPYFVGKDVAKILGCSIALTREIMKREDFPLIKVGKSLKVYAPALDEWARGHRI